MKNLAQYTSKISNLFFDFLAEKITKSELIQELYKIEILEQEKQANDDGEIWFKFSKDDTLATTICNLDFDLEPGKNYDFTIQQIKNSISLMGELQIYYS